MKDITIRFFPLTFASILFFYCKVFRPFEQNDQQTVFHIWGDGFLVAVDNNDVVIGTIAYVVGKLSFWENYRFKYCPGRVFALENIT